MGEVRRDVGGVLAEVEEMLDRLVTVKTRSPSSGKHVSVFVAALERVSGLVGPAPRPVGSGDPGGGRGATLTSQVERAVGLDRDDDRPLRVGPEENALRHLRQLPMEIESRLEDCLSEIGVDTSGILLPDDASPARTVWWCRWAVRQLRRAPALPSDRSASRLFAAAAHLDKVVSSWTTVRTPEVSARAGLVEDLTGMWCRSCLGAGARTPRVDRFNAHGVCRFCGEFHATYRRWPSANVLRARASGATRRTLAKIIRDESRPKKRR